MLFMFDCDGVLVDSEIIASKVDADLLTEIGYEITAEEVKRRFAGLTARSIGAIVEGELGRKLPEDFFESAKAEIDRRLATELKPVAGVERSVGAATPGARTGWEEEVFMARAMILATLAHAAPPLLCPHPCHANPKKATSCEASSLPKAASWTSS